MKQAKTIGVQSWMTAPETAAIMKALDQGHSQRALFVGGCVRNALLGKEVGDIDIATIWDPQEVTQRLEAAGIRVVPTGIDYGTVTAVMNGKPYEITTLRRDVETDGRRAVVAYTDDWAEDAQRRDFTMNTLLADQEGRIFDPTGQGLKDIESRRVRFVGEAGERIAEDHLRILRFFRFHALYGEGEPDRDALTACSASADKISSLSRERITQEFFKIMSVDEPSGALALMFANGVLKEFKFREYDPKFLKYVCDFQLRYGLAFLVTRLLTLAGLQIENVKEMEKILLLPKVFSRDIEAISHVLALPDLADEQAVKVAVYKFGRVPSAQALMIELANDRVMNGTAPKALEIIRKWDIPNFPVSGEDLMKQGMKPGPALGKKLEELETLWIESGFQESKSALLS